MYNLLKFYNTKEDKYFKNKEDEKAFDLYSKMLNKFCKSNIKKYNGDKEKALDDYSAKEFLNTITDVVNIYLDTVYKEDDIKLIKKYLNQNINLSWSIMRKS